VSTERQHAWASNSNALPDGPEHAQFVEDVARRHRSGTIWRVIFQLSTIVGILALTALLYNIINQAFGLVAIENAISPSTLVQEAQEGGMLSAPNPAIEGRNGNVRLETLPKDALVAILREHVSAGLFRRFEADQPFAERTQQNVYQLVLERVVEPKVQETWSLYDSIFHRDSIQATVREEYPGAELDFRSWVSPAFVNSPQSSDPERAGVRTAILGSLWTIAITILVSFPIGVGAAIYLEEYATESRFTRIIQVNINNLAGVPSIIYGLLGLAIFVRTLEALTSGLAFGAAEPGTASGRTILSAGLTLGLLILPIIIINSQEAVRAVPNSLRRASYGLGATKWQTIWHHVLPNAITGILTGTILAVSRAIGETAPLVVVGAATFITQDPSGPFSKFTTLPIQIWQWTTRPQDEFRNIAAAAIMVLLILLLALNASAVLLRNRYSRRL
jgi:phosphate transport system permease protein